MFLFCFSDVVAINMLQVFLPVLAMTFKEVLSYLFCCLDSLRYTVTSIKKNVISICKYTMVSI